MVHLMRFRRSEQLAPVQLVVAEMAAEELAVAPVDPMDHEEQDPLMILRLPEKL
jgi:hypothetical protein